MSYDVYFTADVGGDPYDPPSFADRNYTSNVGGMWYEALGGESLGDVIKTTPLALDLEPKIRRAIGEMMEAPDHFRAMNPPNGWGDYEGALDYLVWIADHCKQWPKARVEVSR